MIVPMVLSKTTLLPFTTNDCSYGTFKDYPPTIYNKWLFLWYFQRLSSYDWRQKIVPMVLLKTALLRFTTNDCSYGTFKDCPPTIYGKWLFLRYFQRLPSYDLRQMIVFFPMVLSKTALLRLTTNDCSYGTFKDYPPTIYDKRLFLWYFQRLPSYDLRQMIVPMVLSKTARLRLTTHDCSYGTLKDCPPTIDDKWLFLWYFQRLPSYDLQQMIVPMVLSKTALLRLTTNVVPMVLSKSALLRLLIVYLVFSLFSWLSWLIWNQKICTDGHKQQQLNALVFVLFFALIVFLFSFSFLIDCFFLFFFFVFYVFFVNICSSLFQVSCRSRCSYNIAVNPWDEISFPRFWIC